MQYLVHGRKTTLTLQESRYIIYVHPVIYWCIVLYCLNFDYTMLQLIIYVRSMSWPTIADMQSTTVDQCQGRFMVGHEMNHAGVQIWLVHLILMPSGSNQSTNQF
jgi:hypothetical protein